MMNATHTTLTEAEIDAIVIADAEDDQAWEEPIQVQKTAGSSLPLPFAPAEGWQRDRLASE